jgi:hypothetical protein
MIPAHIAQQIKDYPARSVPTKKKIGIGDIRVLHDLDRSRSRLCLILNLDHLLDIAYVTLIHTEIDYATEHDLVIQSTESNLPYEFAIQRDLLATVWATQLGELVGTLSKKVVEDVLNPENSERTDFESGYLGARLRGPFDSRWDFKLSEGLELRHFSGSCTNEVLSGTTTLEICDLEVLTAILRRESNYGEMLLCLYEILSQYQGQLFLSPETVNQLAELELLDARKWRTTSFWSHEFEKVLNQNIINLVQITSIRRPETGRIVPITKEKVLERALIDA